MATFMILTHHSTILEIAKLKLRMKHRDKQMKIKMSTLSLNASFITDLCL